MQDLLFPAHAGMIRSLAAYYNALQSVPRTRGDDPARGHTSIKALRCSPHTRG